jgi:hypothetical protein
MDHGGHDAIGLIAALVLVIGGGLFTVRAYRTRPAPPGPAASASRSHSPALTPTPGLERSLSVVLAGLSAGAAAIHLAAAPSHYLEIGDLGAGFVIAAAFQAWTIRWWLAASTRRTTLIGIVGNLAIAIAWLYTRTIGLPVGPFAGGPEPIGYPDGASVAFELLLVAGLAARSLGLDRALSGRRVVRELGAVLVVPVVGLVLVLTSLATVAIATGLDHGTAGHPLAEHVATH